MKKLKILYINNYSCDESAYNQVKNKRYPSNHLWGVCELREKGHHVEFIDMNHPQIKGKKNIIKKLIYKVQKKIYFGKIFRKYKNYDVVYSSQTDLSQTYFFAKSKKKGLCNPIMIAVLHHPGAYIPYSESYDKMIFISKPVLDMRPDFRSIAEYAFWGPDLNFYNYWKNKNVSNRHIENPNELIFVSNGKTRRDNNAFLSAASELDANVIIVCDSTCTPEQKYFSNDKFEIITSSQIGDTISNVDNISLLSKTDIMVIPINIESDVLCGLTSFVDALAMGMPIIMSDNTLMGIDIESEGFGFIYKTGDYKDLKKKMMMFYDDPGLIKKMGEKALDFGKKHSFSNFVTKLEEVINSSQPN